MKPYYTIHSDNKQPSFFRDEEEDSSTEVECIKYLDKASKVKWWFKNGYGEIKYFAVMSTDGGAFYPDFIVQFKDGRIGIFDTKGGFTAKDAKARAEGLQKYIKELNKKGRKVWNRKNCRFGFDPCFF